MYATQLHECNTLAQVILTDNMTTLHQFSSRSRLFELAEVAPTKPNPAPGMMHRIEHFTVSNEC